IQQDKLSTGDETETNTEELMYYRAGEDKELHKKKVESDWLKDCFVGEVCSAEKTDNLEEELRVEGVRCTSSPPVYGRRQEMKEFLDKERGRLSKLFSSIRPWTPQTMDAVELVGLSVMVYPCTLGPMCFFEDFASLWGSLAWVDWRTSSRSNLEFARLSILTSSPRNIQDSINIKIGEDVFTISVMEESLCFSDKNEYTGGPSCYRCRELGHHPASPSFVADTIEQIGHAQPATSAMPGYWVERGASGLRTGVTNN
ncbi:hypothetical protein Ancab_029845, partial [Ancistrocladus abbreviatus]